ncbi:MAG: putative transcriptional regulator, family [Caulobacteraceae bacterium]|nr:putative transcriptional regulator, family [Caulobacteraceae bacterium]
MTIQSILRKKGSAVERIGPTASLKAAIDRMRAKNISALVVAQGDAVVGIIAERDILQALSQHTKSPDVLQVEDAMSQALITVAPEDSVRHAMSLMTRCRVRHLPVMRDGVLLGIVSIGDVVKDRLEDLEAEANVLRDVYIAAR